METRTGIMNEYLDCDFCNELRNEKNLYWDVAKKCNLPQNRIIYEGENWVIMPTIGAIVPGYVLIVSKKHHVSLLNCDKHEVMELEKLIKHTRKVLESVYKLPCIAFEHGGSCNTGNKFSCVDHCHIHVLPLKEDIFNKIDNSKFQIISVKSLTSLMDRKEQHSAYLLYQNQEEQFFVLYSDTSISQYFRQLIALSEGVPEKWNWRHYYFSENMKQTIEEMSSELNKNGGAT